MQVVDVADPEFEPIDCELANGECTDGYGANGNGADGCSSDRRGASGCSGFDEGCWAWADSHAEILVRASRGRLEGMTPGISGLYAIVDRGALDARGIDLRLFAEELRDGGVRLLQYRDKVSGPHEVLREATEIAAIFEGTEATLILNDRADLAALARWSGVHVGHLDLPPEAVKRVLGEGRIVGVSTHNDAQVREAEASCADYVAVGPVFATASKSDTEPVIGLEGLRRMRSLTTKPLVAIGGITHQNAASVMEAGADAVAVIGALLPGDGMTAREKAETFVAGLLRYKGRT